MARETRTYRAARRNKCRKVYRNRAPGADFADVMAARTISQMMDAMRLRDVFKQPRKAGGR